MIKERFVNLEVATLLRNKGFNEPFYFFYRTDDKVIHHAVTANPLIYCDKIDEEVISAPTQQMACDWVEETFNISIVVYVSIIGYLVCICHAHKNPNIASNVIQDDMPCGDNSDGSWSSKELAYNEALKYVLTKLV